LVMVAGEFGDDQRGMIGPERSAGDGERRHVRGAFTPPPVCATPQRRSDGVQKRLLRFDGGAIFVSVYIVSPACDLVHGDAEARSWSVDQRRFVVLPFPCLP
jgi:hypothetical protein